MAKNNSRKTFLKGLALGVLSLPFAIRACGGQQFEPEKRTGAGDDQRVFEWKMVTTWPPGFPILGSGCKLLADHLEKMSNGRLRITVFGGGELVPPLEAFGAVQSGVADLASGAAYYWAGKIPAAPFFASVPFGMNAQQVNAWLLEGGGLELWRKLYADFNLRPYPGGNTGVQMGGWYNREINTVGDLKGLKMRIPGLGGKVLTKVGGSPVLLAGSEIYTGLERGVIDATEWLNPYHDLQMGFHEIAKYYYSPGWHEPGTALEIIINNERFKELPSDLQAMLEVGVAWLNHYTLNAFEAQNALAMEQIRNLKDVELRTFPSAVLDTLRSAALETLEELAENDPATREVYDAYRKFQQKANAWAEISEKSYYLNLDS